ncbi:MAG: hypothetical protein WCF84_22935 [Anaerolineae bacterium]
MKRLYLSLFFVFALLGLMTAGCNTSAPAPATATAAPTTSAPSAPAGTTPGSAVNPPAVPTLGPGLFTDAFKKMSAVTAYRLEIQRTGTGVFSPLAGATGADATPTPAPAGAPVVPDIAIKGTVNGTSSDLTLSGLMASFGGGDPTTGMEILTVGDKSYLHGPVPAMGATADKWYEMPAGTASSIVPAVDPPTLFGSLTQTGIDPNGFKKDGTETLDSRSCDIYSGNKDTTLKAFQDLFKNSQSANFVIDGADSRFWLCDDGYIHQTRLSIDAHVPGQSAQGGTPAVANQPGNFLLTLHLFDYNNNIAIQAPAGAEQLQIPGMSAPGADTPASGGTPAAGGTPTP